MSDQGPPEDTNAQSNRPTGSGDPRESRLFREITGVGSSVWSAILVPMLAVITALLIGGLIIAFTDVDILRLWSDDPAEAFSQTIDSVLGAYRSLFVGSFGSTRAVSETMFAATPLILAGLAVAVGFQAGLFNIGAEGQMLIGGMSALYLGITFDLPGPIMIPLMLLGAMIGGGAWAGIAGFLKARTGAHEVITTIMLNFIAAFLVLWLLKTDTFQAVGREDPISKQLNSSAHLGRMLGGDFRVTIGFFIALGAAAVVGWLMYRTTIGFQYRTVGANPDAARYAGMSVAFLIVAVMATSGSLAGLAGANQVMSLPPYQAQAGFSAGIGFTAIALALVGRSRPIGVVWAGILFGALQAGGREMQGAERIPVDMVLIVQSLIIVFIAAPALIRSIWHLKEPEEEEAEQIVTGWST